MADGVSSAGREGSMMNEFEQGEKLQWHIQHLPGVVDVVLHEKEFGLFRVEVTVAAGEVDAVWDDLVKEVEEFEQQLGGVVGLDLEVTSS